MLNLQIKTVVGYRQGTLVDFGAHQVISGLVKLVDQKFTVNAGLYRSN